MACKHSKQSSGHLQWILYCDGSIDVCYVVKIERVHRWFVQTLDAAMKQYKALSPKTACMFFSVDEDIGKILSMSCVPSVSNVTISTQANANDKSICILLNTPTHFVKIRTYLVSTTTTASLFVQILFFSFSVSTFFGGKTIKLF